MKTIKEIINELLNNKITKRKWKYNYINFPSIYFIIQQNSFNKDLYRIKIKPEYKDSVLTFYINKKTKKYKPHKQYYLIEKLDGRIYPTNNLQKVIEEILNNNNYKKITKEKEYCENLCTYGESKCKLYLTILINNKNVDDEIQFCPNDLFGFLK